MTEAAPGLAVVLLLLLQQGRDSDAPQPQPVDDLWRVIQIAAAVSPVLVAAVLYGLGKYFPGRKEVVSGKEVDDRIAAATKEMHSVVVSKAEMQHALGLFAAERDKFIRQLDFDSRQAFNVEIGRTSAGLREELKRVDAEIGVCRADMSNAKDKASEAANGVAQLETKVSEMDRRLESSIKSLGEILLAKLETIEARLVDRGSPRTRKDDG